MNAKELFEKIREKRSFLCVGLDSDFSKIPEFLKREQHPVFEFNKRIIDATAPYTVAYKPNMAFYEAFGVAGWANLRMTVDYLRENYPEMFLIADAKRGDIGNTSKMYARAFFDTIGFDAITIAPYMGEDSVKPFIGYKDKWAIVLALTSNVGASNFQYTEDKYGGLMLFEKVINQSKNWGTVDNMMYVVGATRADMLKDVRRLVPDHFLLVPGVGAQGGSLSETAHAGMNDQCGLLVNSSRAIIFADSSENFAEIAAQKAMEMQQEMQFLLKEKGIIQEE
ncbi:MAG: orotidine-5'-phosphate decarboxylase [Bacteroidales bacterium]|jgi:orotidine-5'-phosphate decarboxylase|nr:orotidine-5'-phosphate decarboxylase [Bacteroidales bacterium]